MKLLFIMAFPVAIALAKDSYLEGDYLWALFGVLICTVVMALNVPIFKKRGN